MNVELENDVEVEDNITETDDISNEIEVVDEIVDETGTDDTVSDEEQPVHQKPKAKDRIMKLNKNWRTAEKELDDQKTKNTELQLQMNKINDMLNDINTKSTKKEFDSDMKKLQESKIIAIESQDAEQMNAVDMKIMELMQTNVNKSVANNNNVYSNQATDNSVENYFQAKNPWYLKNKPMTKIAISIDEELKKDSYWGSLPIEQRLDEVSNQTNKMFAETATKKHVSGVSGTSSINNSNKASSNQITKAELNVVSKMFPELSLKELKKTTLELKQQL